jgi:hypothetical protein
MLGSLASDVGFNYVALLEDGQTVHMSATDDSCRRAIDLAFLVDASGSISQGDYEKALGAKSAFCFSLPRPPRVFLFSDASTSAQTFLVDLSLPFIPSPGWPLDFVADVAEQFDLGANETRVGMSIFSGYTGHQSTIAGVPDCPEGTLFEANGLVRQL